MQRRVYAAFICALLCVAIVVAAQSVQQLFPSSKPDIVFSGTLSAGKSFQRDIGHGLIFRLVPSPTTFGKGWDIEIRPKGDPAGGFDEYASVATPPYHLYKPTYLNASYGVTAQKAVAMSRRFQFVETPQDSQAASVVVNTVVYTVDWPAHKNEISAAAAKIPVGIGELRVVRSRITPGKNNEDLGSIDWIKFQVRLWLHSGTTLEQVLFPGDAH
ncbi:MAG TPA: hypothetical protein VJS43_08835 [Candidatus Acidoferrales bacterium]|nr:hypothetical protein [Candidatus Acidoferrales bacterium]